MKIKPIKISTLIFSLALVTSCSSEIAENVSSQGAVLQVQTDIANTRSVITGTTFSKGDSIGVCVLNATGSVYAANSLNILAAYNGTKWNLKSPLTLSEDSAKVFAYYPYRAEVTSSLSVDITPNATTGQPDYLYGVAASAVNAESPVAKLHFNHLLSRITLQITKASTDTGIGALTSVSVGNITGATVIATTGTADIKTFTIEPTANTAAKITQTVGSTLSTTAVNVDFLVIPTTINDNAELSLTVDGQEYDAKIPAITWTAGKQYVYPVVINRLSSNPVAISIGMPDITPWNNNAGGCTAITNENEEKSTFPAGGTVGNVVDLGLSVKWADHNLGATKPEDYGGYFAWGETETKSGYSVSESKWDNVSRSSLQSQGIIDSNGNLAPAYDAATHNWGKNWRMPTKKEQDDLRTKCTWIWTANNGINGYKVVGTNGHYIFLPAAGYCYKNNDLYNAGDDGTYWSSTVTEDDSYGACYMYFYSNYYSWHSFYRYYCRSIRPVTE